MLALTLSLWRLYSLRLPLPGPLEPIDLPAVRAAGVRLFCKRDDLFTLAPGTALQGNKVRKLLGVLQAALAAKTRPVLVSFGGAYSNHLAALSTAGKLYDLPVVLFVRGEEVDNPILAQARADGARLIHLSRTEYRRKYDEDWLKARRLDLAAEYQVDPAKIWFVPEGGTSPEAVRTVEALYPEIVDQLGAAPEVIAVSAGTGGTAAGLIRAASDQTLVEVYSALKGNWMTAEIAKLLPANHPANWTVITDYHYGGYGKFPQKWLVPSTGLAKRARVADGLPPLEPVYTAKLFSGVLDRLRKGKYPSGSTVVIVHTGGIY
ncbi:MAG: pyridoxal-phosphate dependent enzyme [Bacteroidota bacterium]